MSHSFAVLIPAAGSGSRFGADKLLSDLGGKTVLRRSVELFASRAEVACVVVITSTDRIEAYSTELTGIGGTIDFAPGGRERWESVINGLRHASKLPSCPKFVAIHDAARPLCPQNVIDHAFREAISTGGSLPCIAEPATLKRADGAGRVAETIDRRGLFQAQTPQCFELRKLLLGYEKLLAQSRIADLTDDAQVYERMGWAVGITQGAATNLKITTPEDLVVARGILAAQK